MKRYPKIIQCDSRGQIVIPKDIRRELGIEEGSGFYVYSITDEGVLLKKVKDAPLEEQRNILSELIQKSDKIDLSKQNIVKSLDRYKRRKNNNLEDI